MTSLEKTSKLQDALKVFEIGISILWIPAFAGMTSTGHELLIEAAYGRIYGALYAQ